MIKGQYWHVGNKADLIRPLSDLPRKSGALVTIVIAAGKVFDCALEVRGFHITLICPEYEKMVDMIGWFPR